MAGFEVLDFVQVFGCILQDHAVKAVCKILSSTESQSSFSSLLEAKEGVMADTVSQVKR